MEAASRDTQKLVEQARGGDAAAYERLFRTYSGKLEAAIASDMGDALKTKLDPKDVLQETYLEALRDFRSFEYRGTNSLLAWFRAIARNKLRELNRHFFQAKKREVGRERRPKTRADATGTRTDPIDQVPGRATTPTRAARRSENEAALASRLARLPRDYRLVLSLVKIEELPIAEAARAMGRSEGAVKKLLARALEALRAEFERDHLQSPLD